MLDFVSSFHLSPQYWLLVILSITSLGANKTGLEGLSLVVIPVLASVFGGKASTGVVLPFLILADIFAVFSYRKDIQWKYLVRILPWSFLGILIALFVGDNVSDQLFKILIASIILLLVLIMLYKMIRRSQSSSHRHWYITVFSGLLGGFSTMIGNAAGPVMAVFFLSLNLKKNEYIATRAWFFWIVNLVKIPLHVFVWHTINAKTLTFNLLLSPAIAAGALFGLWVVQKIPDKPYRVFILVITFLTSLLMFL